jgi:hypothetical protein
MMFSNLLKAALLRRAGLISCCLALVMITQLVGAGRIPVQNLKLDPKAAKVELFDGMEDGSLTSRLIPDDIHGGNVFIENKTNKPLTVILPEAVVGVHVLKQMGGMMGGMGGGGMGGMGGGMGGMGGGMGGGGMGGGQSMGGGMGGMGGGMGGGGGGFFSIPPHKVAQVPFQSVCLNYGKPDPMPKMTYVLVPVEKFVESKVLQELLRIYGTGKMDYSIAQAATWHLTDKLSLEDLLSMRKSLIPGDSSADIPVFSLEELQAASRLVAVAEKRAEERAKLEPKETKKKSTPVKSKTKTKADTAQAKAGR